jgi:hypothetical protein
LVVLVFVVFQHGSIRLKWISSGSSTIDDVRTLEDGTSIEEVRQVFDDLHKSIG